jgi:hypothetical protein
MMLSRIAAGLKKLRAKMTSSGVSVPSVVLAAYLQDQALAAAPATLRALLYATGKSSSAATAAALKIADGTTKTLLWMQAKFVASVLLAVVFSGIFAVLGWNALVRDKTTNALPPAAAAPARTVQPRKKLPIDFANLPLDTWVNIDYAVEPASQNARATGSWQSSSSYRLTYNSQSQRVLFLTAGTIPRTTHRVTTATAYSHLIQPRGT